MSAGADERERLRELNLRTHMVVGLGFSGFTASLLGCNPTCYFLALSLSLLHHPIIDYTSHRRGRRTVLFHSIIGVLLLALATSLPFTLVFPPETVYVLLLSSTASCMSHWLLDLTTIGGVFIVKNRVSLRLFRYDDPLPNISFQAMGVSLLLYSLVALAP